MLAACLEHAAELRWAPALKQSPLASLVSALGVAAIVGGELLRKAAMVGGGVGEWG